MVDFGTGDVLAVVLGSLLFLIITAFILYYIIFSSSRKSNYVKFLDQYEKLNYDEKRIFTESLISRAEGDTNRPSINQIPRESIPDENSYKYQKVFEEDEETPYPEPSINDQILNEVSGDKLMTPLR